MIKALILLTFVSSVIAQQSNESWSNLIETHKPLMTNHDYELIRGQYEAYRNNQLPKIADDVIKAIPIQDTENDIIDLRTISNSRIIMMDDPQQSYQSPEHNAGLSETSVMRLSVYKRLQNMIERLDAISITSYYYHHQLGYRQNQFSIKVFEALRSLESQAKLFEEQKQKLAQTHPAMTEDALFQETCKWVSPVNNIPVHSTGAAVDIRLWDNINNQLLDMGPFGVIWVKNETAPMFSENLSFEQKRNRMFFLLAATQAGLINYPYEFWHFSFGDRYEAYWHHRDHAMYGPVKLDQK